MSPSARLPVSRLHGTLLTIGWVPAVVLLGRLAFDFGRLDVLFGLPVGVLCAAALAIGARLALAALRGDHAPVGPRARAALVLLVPLGLLGTVLGCMGLQFRGCTPACGFLMQAWAPLVSALALLFLATSRPWLLVATSTSSLAFLVPNCVCRNPVNAGWMDLLGESPACYAPAFAVILLSAGALRTGRQVAPALAVGWSTVLAMFGFFVGHHVFGYPW